MCSTSDHVLICRHDCELSSSTDVAKHPEFADRKRNSSYSYDASYAEKEGWFTEDFTWAEIKTLRSIERIPNVRPQNSLWNELFPILSLEQFIQIHLAVVDSHSSGSRTPLTEATQGQGLFQGPGLYIETKHPSYFRSIGLPLENPLVELLNRAGYREMCAKGRPYCPIFLQSFEDNLSTLQDLAPYYPSIQVKCQLNSQFP